MKKVLSAPLSTSELQIPIREFGPGGLTYQMKMLPKPEGDERKDEDRLNDASERKFNVFAKLSKNLPKTERIDGNFTKQDGYSYISLGNQDEEFAIERGKESFKIHKNSRNEISMLEFTCTSESIYAASCKFKKLALPMLDYFSYLANVPLTVELVRVEDQINHVVSIEFKTPYSNKTINIGAGRIDPNMEPIYAMYREAKNSNSDIYKFLCYYKILEALFGKYRSAIRVEARALGLELTKTKNIIAESEYIYSEYNKYIGKSIEVFYNEVLTPQFRNSVAHFIDDDNKFILNHSAPEHMDKFNSLIYITEFCVRTAIESHEKLIKELLDFIEDCQQ